MEFRLNKIDSDIRERLDENISTDKIHESKSDAAVKNLKGNEQRNNGKAKIKKRKKKIITIEATIHSNIIVNVEAEKIGTINEENSKGINLDAKK